MGTSKNIGLRCPQTRPELGLTEGGRAHRIKPMSTSSKKPKTGRFHTETFEKAGQPRKDAVIQAALDEFSEKGFHGTSVNDIARMAGVSIGSLYSYFPSKDDLFLSLVEKGHNLLEEALSGVDPEAPFFESVEAMLNKAYEYGLSNPKINHIYQEATTQGLHHLSARLSGSLESLTVKLYRTMLESAKRKGQVRDDMDLGAAAFCVDNLILNFQFSITSSYYQARLRIFLGIADGEEPDTRALISEIMKFIRRALS